jgi:hypothetical protein
MDPILIYVLLIALWMGLVAILILDRIISPPKRRAK